MQMRSCLSTVGSHHRVEGHTEQSRGERERATKREKERERERERERGRAADASEGPTRGRRWARKGGGHLCRDWGLLELFGYIYIYIYMYTYTHRHRYVTCVMCCSYCHAIVMLTGYCYVLLMILVCVYEYVCVTGVFLSIQARCSDL